jgi:hypothetical protein
MFLIIAIAFVAILALIVGGFTLHLLFSPWLWLLAICVLVWLRFRNRRTRR